MSDDRVKTEMTDLAAAVVLFAVGCTVGNVCANIFGDSSLAFSLPTLTTMAGGEYAWKRLKKGLID